MGQFPGQGHMWTHLDWVETCRGIAAGCALCVLSSGRHREYFSVINVFLRMAFQRTFLFFILKTEGRALFVRIGKGRKKQ